MRAAQDGEELGGAKPGGAKPGGGRARRRAVLLMGPTASGKSALALRLAEEMPFEIISVDSAQIYRGMDIGTAKPDAATRARVAHHLIDIRDPAESYSAGQFARDAQAAMQDIWRRGRQPLLVGGTMLYFHTLSAGIAKLPEADPEIRASILRQAANNGWSAVHAELSEVDPAAAARIHVNDPQRLQRALEVYRLTGETITSLQGRRVSVLSGVDVREFVLAPLERRDLHTRIGLRFDAMLDAGLVAEVRSLYDRGDLTAEHPSMRAVGYRQLWRYVAGHGSVEQAREASIVATRQLAKRQLTWLRRRAAARWLDSMHPDVAGMMTNALSESADAQFSTVTP